MLAAATSCRDERTADVWRAFLSTGASLVQEFSVESDEELLACLLRLRFRTSNALLHLYEKVCECPPLAPHLNEWFVFGDVSRAVRGPYSPITRDVLSRVEGMSQQEAVAVIEGTGLLPRLSADRQAWVDAWKNTIGGGDLSDFIYIFGQDMLDHMRAIQRNRDRLPAAYLHAGAIAVAADYLGVLAARMIIREAGVKEGKREKWDADARSRFAVTFLAEHQDVMAAMLSDESSEENDIVFVGVEDPLALLTQRRAFEGFDIPALIRNATATLQQGLGVNSQCFMRILTDPVLAMYGRLLEHRDVLLLFLFNHAMFAAFNDLRRASDGAETDAVFLNAVLYQMGAIWPDMERMLNLQPIGAPKWAARLKGFIAMMGPQGHGGIPGMGNGNGVPGNGASGTPPPAGFTPQLAGVPSSPLHLAAMDQSLRITLPMVPATGFMPFTGLPVL